MLVLFISLLVFFLIGMPVAFALGVGSLFALIGDNSLPLGWLEP